MLPKPLQRDESACGCLAFLAGGQGHLDLSGKLIKIGKDPASEIVVKGFWVGWAAATISRRPDGYYLNYAGGISKPRVNEQTVKKSVMLHDLDVIAIGSVKLQFFHKTPGAPRIAQSAAGGGGPATV